MSVNSSRKNVTQPDDWWKAFEQAARDADMDLSSWLGEAAKAMLPPKVSKKLSERATRGRPIKEEENDAK
jgi:hypothetical protein